MELDIRSKLNSMSKSLSHVQFTVKGARSHYTSCSTLQTIYSNMKDIYISSFPYYVRYHILHQPSSTYRARTHTQSGIQMSLRRNSNGYNFCSYDYQNK